jgi:leucyl-tRNA synthetase
MATSYDPSTIEPKWAAAWEAEGTYQHGGREDLRPRFYALDMFPYPSGDLHMGHAEAFALGDAIPRFKAMQGFNVFHPIGWDSFGLPAENAAIQRGIHPKEWTYANIEKQAASFRRYGVSFDWRTRLHTSDPEFYRWTQWLFLRLLDRGLAYRKLAPANWCPKDQTVLANEQVVAGHCERCGTAVVRKDLTQWFFRITAYAQALLDDMDQLEEGWPERVLTLQRNWIGRSDGAEIEFEIAETGEQVTVFTTRPDTLWGLTFMAFAPEHPMVDRLAAVGGVTDEVAGLRGRLQAAPLTAREEADSREGIALGVHAVNPANGEKVPCFVAPYVLLEYGTGAVGGVPAHDQRDLEFARRHGLAVRVVIQPEGKPLDAESMTEAWPGEGVMVSSGPFDGTPIPQGIPRVIQWLQAEGKGRPAVSYRLRDWLISRQRYWGCPIPVIHCPDDGVVPVPYDDLPVLLPDDVDFSPKGESPLAKHEGFVNVACPRCGKPARRETDTIDTFIDSSWYFFRYLSPHDRDRPFDQEEVERWMPVDQYVGGVEHATGHLIYSRFITKVLQEEGMISFREPFLRLINQGQVIMEGARMSKSRGNIVEPMPLVDRYGADTIRVTMLFANKPEDDIDWADVSPEGVHDWLRRVWRAVHEAAKRPGRDPDELRRSTHRRIRWVTRLYEDYRFNVAVARLMELTNDIRSELDRGQSAREAATALVLMMAPMAPFIAEELWREVLGGEGSVHHQWWPGFDPGLAREETLTMVVQVDGRVRDRLEVPAEVSEDEAERLARDSANARRAIGDRRVVRVVARPPRLVNLVTAD